MLGSLLLDPTLAPLDGGYGPSGSNTQKREAQERLAQTSPLSATAADDASALLGSCLVALSIRQQPSEPAGRDGRPPSPIETNSYSIAADATGTDKPFEEIPGWDAILHPAASNGRRVGPLGPVRSTLYVGTTAGVYSSTDGGTTWMAAGLELSTASVRSIVIDPNVPSRVYAGTHGLFRSVDGGAHWININPYLNASALAIDPINTALVYAGDDGASSFCDPLGVCYCYAVGSVYKSNDGGDSWTATGPVRAVSALAIDPIAPSIVRAAVFDYYALGSVCQRYPEGIIKFTAGGWSTTGLGDLIDVRAMVVDWMSPATVYAVATDAIWKTVDGDQTWFRVGQGTVSGGLSIAMDPTSPSIVYVGALGVFKTTNGGANWTEASVGLPRSLVNALAIDPMNPSVIYAATSDGVFVSTDGAESWRDTSAGLPNRYIQTIAVA
jgi:photosystem II stability/assembly factor-like uncharacterized protein